MRQNKKKNIIFIIYKAGWWGCFESLYLELSICDENECHVIPIPYYERSKDGKSLDYNKKHYEARLLPKEIPITDYRDYNLREHRPDIIYIHNPYDDSDPAESVDPEYYSEKLKEITDQLIYIPHMLYLEGLPELMRRSSVYKNADKIIITNNYMKRSFTDVQKNKFVTAGSPIVDHLEKLSNTKLEFPETWKIMLPDPMDFQKKRIILYYTSYDDLFLWNENTIRKIAYVLEYMKSRKDIIFVWRAESEIEKRIGDLPASVQSNFLDLRDNFIKDKVGIYDTTDDEALVSVLTDAYIGSYHPIINLYGLQGKPIILLDKEQRHLPTDDELGSVSFMDFVIEDNDIWFVADEYNLLCRMNLSEETVEVIDKIPDDQIYGAVNYCGIVKEKDKIYLNPHHAEGVVTYDMKKREFTKTYLAQPIFPTFDYIAEYKDDLILKAKQYPAIVRYNKFTEEMTYYSGWVDELETYVMKGDSGQPYFLWGTVILQNRLMIASSKANIVMEFNMETGEHKIYEVGEKGSKYFGMEYDGTDFWLIPYLGRNLTRWNDKTGEWFIYDDYSNEIKENSIPFRSIIKYNQFLTVFPCQADFGLTINIDNHIIKKNYLDLPYDENNYRSDFYRKANTAYNLAKYIGNGIILAESMYDSSVLLINLNENKIRKIPCRIPLNEVKTFYDRTINQSRNLSDYPCSISEEFTLRVIEEYLKDSKTLINNHEKQVFYLKVEKYDGD